jgi:riboflavin biosynthesis pyrimidine reductase
MKPYVICHMMPSVDGRLRTERWGITGSAMDEYNRTADTYRADAWLAGRTSMEGYAKGRFTGRLGGSGKVPRVDFVVPREKGQQLGVALDAHGKLAWSKPDADGDPLVVVVGMGVSDAYLRALRDSGISYIFAGNGDRLDLTRALNTLRTRFGVRKLILEGGGTTNGAFLRAGLIDELSLLLMPVADGGPGEPALFDSLPPPSRALAKLTLKSVRRRAGGVLWIRYRVRRTGKR